MSNTISHIKVHVSIIIARCYSELQPLVHGINNIPVCHRWSSFTPTGNYTSHWTQAEWIMHYTWSGVIDIIFLGSANEKCVTVSKMEVLRYVSGLPLIRWGDMVESRWAHTAVVRKYAHDKLVLYVLTNTCITSIHFHTNTASITV